MRGRKKHQINPHHSWLASLDESAPEKRIVQRTGFTHGYKRSTLASSIHQACMNATGFIGEAELTAQNVCQEVEDWLENKYEVTSADIQRVATKALKKYNPQAAFEYAPSPENKLERDEYGFVRL